VANEGATRREAVPPHQHPLKCRTKIQTFLLKAKAPYKSFLFGKGAIRISNADKLTAIAIHSAT